MLCVLTSHPIQYQAPLWREIAKVAPDMEVLFLTDHGLGHSYDFDFGTSFSWDIDLLSGYNSSFLPIRKPFNIRSFSGIRLTKHWGKILRERNVKYLWVEGWRFAENWKAVLAAKKNKIKIILRGESNNIRLRRGLRAKVHWLLLQRFFRRIDYFLYIGTANRLFYESYGVSGNQLRYAPYCVENERFSAVANNLENYRAAIRSKWGIAQDSFVSLFCGKLTNKKRPLDLVNAIAFIQRHTSISPFVVFAGAGELADAVRLRMAETGVRGIITGFINQADIPEIYVVANCLVLPSDSGETWGLVVNEALACGRPAIISDQCGCACDLGRMQGDGHVFPCGDIEALAKCIVRISQETHDPRKYQKLIESHDMRHTVSALEKILSE